VIACEVAVNLVISSILTPQRLERLALQSFDVDENGSDSNLNSNYSAPLGVLEVMDTLVGRFFNQSAIVESVRQGYSLELQTVQVVLLNALLLVATGQSALATTDVPSIPIAYSSTVRIAALNAIREANYSCSLPSGVNSLTWERHCAYMREMAATEKPFYRAPPIPDGAPI
jgi:hypothetical protein